MRTPQIRTFHAAECCDYDAEDGDGTTKGKAIGTYAVVTLQARGLSGVVKLGSDLSVAWEDSDGTLVEESLVLMQYEEIDQLTDNATTVRTGQKTGGDITFKTSDKAGKVSISSGFDDDEPVVVWSP